MERLTMLGLMLQIIVLMSREFISNTDGQLMNCSESDRGALLDFKTGLEDPENRLSSWKGSNCCRWRGISCDKAGAVTTVDLHNPYPRFYGSSTRYGFWNLSGEIRPSLTKLKSLTHLDLSFNTFIGIPIPNYLGSLENLQYLNLSNAGFSGLVPSNLGNLSSLQYLDVSSTSSSLRVVDLDWVRGLVSLKNLVINSVDLSMVGPNWISMLNQLPSLTELHMSSCGLFGSIPPLASVNFTSFALLSFNSFNSKIPDWLVNISSLVTLDISYSGLHGRIPLGFGELPNLQSWSLVGNNM